MRKILLLLPLALSLLTGCSETQNQEERAAQEEKSEMAPLPRVEEEGFGDSVAKTDGETEQSPPGGIFHLKPRDKIAAEEVEETSSKKPDCNIPGQCGEDEPEMLDAGKKISGVFATSDVDSKDPVTDLKPVFGARWVEND
jgi:hypothetical protein